MGDMADWVNDVSNVGEDAMSRTASFLAKCTVETDKAILVEIEDEEYWIPQSQIDDDSQVWQRGDEGELVITEWIATEKGLL